MKVLIDTVGVPGQGGGAVVAELLQHLPLVRPDWSFGACLMRPEARDYDAPALHPGFEILEGSRDSNYWDRLRWFHRDIPVLIERWRPDVVLSLNNLLPVRPAAPLKAVLIHQANILPGARFVDRISWRTRLRYFLLRQAVRITTRVAGAIVVQSQLMREGLMRLDASLASKIRVIPNGFRTHLEQWPVSDRVQHLMQAQKGFNLLTYVAYPRPHKNHLRLLEAWRRVHARLPNWRLALTLAPQAPLNGLAADVDRLFALIHDNGMADSVVLLGNLNPSEVDFVLRGSGAMIFPSLAESFGLPLVEALHARCPIVASDLPFSREILGAAGIYFNPLMEDEMAAAILHVASDDVLRASLRQQCEQRESLFDYRNIADSYCRMLEEAYLSPKRKIR